MEIHKPSIQGTRSAQNSEDKLKVDVTRVSRERVQQAADESIAQIRARVVEPERKTDELELSEEAQRLARQATGEPSDDDKRAERVRELKSEHAAGTLYTRERLERAAERMLRSSGE
ncbi:MAG: hypothetical protein ACKVWV_18675 [Planctomycetota bacterium]